MTHHGEIAVDSPGEERGRVLRPIRWEETFRHLTSPRPGEALASIMLRVDALHAVGAGSTATYTRRWGVDPSVPLRFILGRAYALDLLARRLAIANWALVATTFRLELEALYGGSVNGFSLSRSYSTRVCPRCVVEGPIIRRDQFLPHVEGCEPHGVALQMQCTCGLALRLAGSSPFHCRCGKPWATLPVIPLSEASRAKDRTVLTIYRTLFRHGNQRVLSRLIWMTQRRSQSSVLWSPRDLEITAPKRQFHTSLATIIRLLLAVPMKASEYLPYLPARDTPRCPNQGCQVFEPMVCLDGDDETGARAFACLRCATRFTRRRVLQSFVAGLPGVTQYDVRMAKARLDRWRRRLRTISPAGSAEHPETVDVRDAIVSAGIPFSRGLLSDSLGLVEILRHAAVDRDLAFALAGDERPRKPAFE
jgi:hypothetical protein